MAPRARAGCVPGGVPKFWTRPAAVLAVEQVEAITAAALSLSGSSITELENVGVAAVSLTLAGQVIAEAETVGITAAVLSLSGQAVTITDVVIDIVTVDSGALTLAGQAIVETERIGVTAASLALAGQTIGGLDTETIAPATLAFAGQDIGVIDPVEPPYVGAGAGGGGGRGWWRRRRRRERENIELILRDLLLPGVVAEPVFAPRISARTSPIPASARRVEGKVRRRLLATTYIGDELPPPRVAMDLGFDPGLLRLLDSLPRISLPSTRPEPDEDEEEIALLLAILFDGLPHISSPPIRPLSGLDEEDEEIAVLLATLELG